MQLFLDKSKESNSLAYHSSILALKKKNNMKNLNISVKFKVLKSTRKTTDLSVPAIQPLSTSQNSNLYFFEIEFIASILIHKKNITLNQCD